MLRSPFSRLLWRGNAPSARVMARVSADTLQRTHADAPVTVSKSAQGGAAASHASRATTYHSYSAGTTSGADYISQFQAANRTM